MLLLNTRAVAAVSAAAAAIALAGLATPAADAAFPGIDGRFAYSKPAGGGSFTLHVVNPDGTEPLQLTHHEGSDFDPEWSPDSEKIVYAHQTDEGTTLRLYTWDTQEDVELQDFGANPTWHPDGQHIVYDFGGGLYMRSADPDSEEAPVPLLEGDGASAAEPAVKPDGTAIAFTQLGSDGDIKVLDIASGEVGSVTSNTQDEGAPQWHPTQGRLTFWREVLENQQANTEIYGIALGEAQATRLTNDPQVDYEPVYAPSGASIAWRSQRTFANVSFARIWTMTTAGASQAPIAAGVNAFQPHWGSNLDPVPVDTDGDGVKDGADNCPEIANPGQENNYGDSRGDACEDKPVVKDPDPKTEPKQETKVETRTEAPSVATPVVAPVVTPVQLPRAETVKSVTIKRCVSKRRFQIRLRAPRGAKIAGATVKLNGKRAKVAFADGRHRATVDLRNLPKGRFKVDIAVKTADGKTVKSVRRYRTCAGKKA